MIYLLHLPLGVDPISDRSDLPNRRTAVRRRIHGDRCSPAGPGQTLLTFVDDSAQHRRRFG
jgi:hypothetical protein